MRACPKFCTSKDKRSDKHGFEIRILLGKPSSWRRDSDLDHTDVMGLLLGYLQKFGPFREIAPGGGCRLHDNGSR
jgi:hypothetical protein